MGILVYNETRNKSLKQCLNKIGLSISHDQVFRIRTALAANALNSSESIPMPGHFDPQVYVTAAFDNFDHEEATLSGINGTHDTVTVIFQDDTKYNKNVELIHKPRERTFLAHLKCQELQVYSKPLGHTNIPENFEINDKHKPVTVQSYTNNISKSDFSWFLSRIDIFDSQEMNVLQDYQSIPSWSAYHSVLSEQNNIKQIAGFLPVLPYPVTIEETVFTSLQNLENLLIQLKQDFLPVTCDEGVYCIARDIQLKTGKFEKLILCLGSFHLN